MKLLSRCAVLTFVLGIVAWALGGVVAGEHKVKVGDKAPALKGVDENGKTWKSTDVVGKKVLVLYFYPADFTGGCTAQACGFRDDIEKLGSKDVVVIGVSGDSVANHKLFKEDFKLPFTLLADEKGDLANLFGVPVSKGGTATGKKASGEAIKVTQGVRTARFTIVIDKAGKVAGADQIGNAGGDAKRVAELVKKLDTK